MPAQLDTSAYKTVVPLKLAQAFKLKTLREVPTGGLDGSVVLLPTFLLHLTIRGLNASLPLEVLASGEEPFVLLGRDVLNRFKVVLDGPSLAMEIS